MKTVHRGARLFLSDMESIKQKGMKYYWDNAEHAIRDVYNAIETFHKTPQLGR